MPRRFGEHQASAWRCPWSLAPTARPDCRTVTSAPSVRKDTETEVVMTILNRSLAGLFLDRHRRWEVSSVDFGTDVGWIDADGRRVAFGRFDGELATSASTGPRTS